MNRKHLFFYTFCIVLIVAFGTVACVQTVRCASAENALRAERQQNSALLASSSLAAENKANSQSGAAVSSQPAEPSSPESSSAISTVPVISSSSPSSASPEPSFSGKRMAYLTFDDGPSYNTPVLLNILKQCGVPATFFTVAMGHDTPQLRTWLRMEYEDGNTVGLHSFTHNYNYIYASEANFLADFNEMESIITEATGHKPAFCRFPGGTDNTVSIRVHKGVPIMPLLVKDVEARGYTPVDWNAGAIDAVIPVPSKETIVNTVVEQCRSLKTAVILLHDSEPHASSVQAVPEIVAQLRAMGFTFGKLTPGTPVITRAPATHR